MEISESTWAFIAKHRREDVRDVALHAKHDGDVDVPFALEQIAGWQRASLKLPDWASHDGLIFRRKSQWNNVPANSPHSTRLGWHSDCWPRKQSTTTPRHP